MTTLLLRALAAVVVLAAFAAGIVGFLVVAFEMQVEFAGNGMRPLFSFGAPDAHYAVLEADRASRPADRAAPLPESDGPAAAERMAGGSGEIAAPGASTAAAGTTPSVAGVDAAEADPATPAAREHDAYWTDFRGPRRDGLYTQTAIRGEWPATGLEPLWIQPVGGGYASFVIADRRAFTIEQRRDEEVVAAYDIDTGAELWTHAWSAHFRETMGGPGPRATPTWHDGRLYALGATGRLACLDAATGAVLWERDILDDAGARNLPWAMSGAPLVVDDLVIVQPGGTRDWSIAAYDRLTGEVAWHGLDDVQSYTSPMLATLDGVRQIVVVTAERAAGLLPSDGTLLWEYPWTVRVVPNIAQPLVISDTRIFLSAGYGKGAALVELTRTGDRFNAATVWETNRMKNKFSSSVLIDGYIYGLDESILGCIDAATGELMWKGGRYGYGQLLAAGDHLVVLTERGDLVLVRATPDGHEEVAGFRAIEGKTWNVPAMADGRILVRNARQMAAFDLSR